jgi:hypothetical protein
MSSPLSFAAKALFTLGVGALSLVGAQVGAIAASTDHGHSAMLNPRTTPTFSVAQILLGSSLRHTFIPSGSTTPVTEPLSLPDDITQLGDRLFVGFQNGVSATGGTSTDGNTDSTVVELSRSGHVLGQWDVNGRADGLTAVPFLDGVIATVNEDGNSSLYVIRPGAATPGEQVTHYEYSTGLTHGGGTDSIAVVDGQILISASSPSVATGPAVYQVKLQSSTLVAQLTPLFFDNSSATGANFGAASLGTTTTLALTDPDSSEIVPENGPRFGGDFVLTSQGDLEQIYVSQPGTPQQRLSVLALTQSVDDTAWTTSESGRLYSTDATNDSVDSVSGPFRSGQVFTVATPCGANSAPANCTTADYLATLDPWTGLVTPVAVAGAPYNPKGGLLYDSPGRHDGDGGGLGSGGQDGGQH